MALNWNHVEKIRQAQSAAKDPDIITDTRSNMSAATSSAGRVADVPRLDQYEALIFKIRAQLIDYIVAHGLVDGLVYDGTLRATESGKIVITKEMVDTVVDALGYYKAEDVLAYLEKYLPDNFYVSDEFYIHTDNNFKDDDVDKLDSIEYGAEVNRIIDVIFNDKSMLDSETRVATITITPEMIKEWYESNENTNAFTDEALAELEELWNRLDYLDAKVDDVLLDGESIVKNKIAYLTALKIKNSYEANPDTNAYTDAAKAIVESIPALRTRVELDEQRIDELERTVVVLRNDLTTESEERVAADTALEKKHDEDVRILEEKIDDVADSVSELGDEVNRIGGDVEVLKDTVTNIVFEHVDSDPESSDYYNFQLKETSEKVWGVRTDTDGNVTRALYTTTDAISSDPEDEYRVVNKKYVQDALAALPTGGSSGLIYVPNGYVVAGENGPNDELSPDGRILKAYDQTISILAHNMPVLVTPTIEYFNQMRTVVGLKLRTYLSEISIKEYADAGESQLYRAEPQNAYYLEGTYSVGSSTTVKFTDQTTMTEINIKGSQLMCRAVVGSTDLDLHGSSMSRSYVDIYAIAFLPENANELTVEITNPTVEFVGNLTMRESQ